jgi:hypothetical protein
MSVSLIFTRPGSLPLRPRLCEFATLVVQSYAWTAGGRVPNTQYAVPAGGSGPAITPELFQSAAIPVSPNEFQNLAHVQRLA